MIENNNSNQSPETAVQVTQEKNVHYEDAVVKKIIGNALAHVDGILGPSGGVISKLTDKIRKEDEVDVTSGVTATVDEAAGVAEVEVKIIGEIGKNLPHIVDAATEEIRKALKESMGLGLKSFKVDVVEVMTREEYQKKFRTPRDEAKDESKND